MAWYDDENKKREQEQIVELEPETALLDSEETGLRQSQLGFVPELTPKQPGLLQSNGGDSLFRELKGMFGDNEPEEEPDFVSQLGKETEAAKTKADESFATLQSINDQYRAEQEARLASMQRPLTDDELDKRRAAGTLVGTITSALANIANGISVSRGGLNATVPDGYSLSYQHWNDIEKRNKARQQEFDKIKDSILQSRMTEAQLQYGKDSKEYEEAKKLEQTARTIQQKHENDMEKINSRGTWQVKVKETASPNSGKKSSGGGGGGKKSTPKTLDDYRTITNATTQSTVTIPDDIGVEQAYIALANMALNWVEANDPLNDALKAKFRINMTGDMSTKKNVINQLLKDIRLTGLTEVEMQNAIDALTPSQPKEQPTTTTQRSTKKQNTNGNGGTGSTDDPAGAF